MISNAKQFREGLIEAIKIAGQWIKDNAEDIAGNTDVMSRLMIDVDFDPEMGSIPEITITRSHFPETEQINKILDKFNGKKEKPALIQCRDCGRSTDSNPNDLIFYELADGKCICRDCRNKTNELVIRAIHP